MKVAYLDASALVKLFKPEPETDALSRTLADWPVWASSELLAVEARCTARRLGDGPMLAEAAAALAGVDLVRYTAAIRERAGGSFQPALRALDAIHLATALTIQNDLGILVAYDEDLRAAGAIYGLPIRAPA